MNSQEMIRLKRSFSTRLGGGLPPAMRLAAAAVLLSAGVFAPRAVGQTVGPITPNPSAAPAQQTPRATPPPAPAPTAKTNLAGSWKMNKDESDDPREKMREAANNSGAYPGNGGQGRRGGGWGGLGGPGMGGPGTGQGPWGGGGGQGGGGWPGNQGGNNNGQDQDARNGGAMDMNDLYALNIEQSDTAAKVTGESGRVLATYSSSNPDATNKPPSRSSDDSTYTPPAAQLQNGQLVVVTPGRQRGAKTTRTYALSDDKTQLWVTTKIENPRFSEPVTIRLVYDQAKPGSGA